jgi:hypothetical protein
MSRNLRTSRASLTSPRKRWSSLVILTPRLRCELVARPELTGRG